MLNGLSQISIELTNICDKPNLCTFCGHQKDGTIERGYMDFELLKNIAQQIPNGIIVSFHRSGEPTAYPELGQALALFKNNITSLVTHGMNLLKKASEIINNCTTLTVSVYRNDPDAKEQLEILRKFMALKGLIYPQVQVKLVGDVDPTSYEAIKRVRIIRRNLHSPKGSFGYIKQSPSIPEVGICLDLLGKPSINWQGDVSICNRFDPKRLGVIGNIKEQSLDEILNSDLCKQILNAHISGHRELIPVCAKCEYWGCPTNG